MSQAVTRRKRPWTVAVAALAMIGHGLILGVGGLWFFELEVYLRGVTVAAVVGLVMFAFFIPGKTESRTNALMATSLGIMLALVTFLVVLVESDTDSYRELAWELAPVFAVPLVFAAVTIVLLLTSSANAYFRAPANSAAASGEKHGPDHS